jgi:shikimate dehydrogenase
MDAARPAMKLALIGDPVEHSGSPRLHRHLLEDAGIDGSYVTLRVPRGAGASAIERLRVDGYTGCNVTYPLKEEAAAACESLGDEARRAGAVNTIFFGRRTLGTNTDGIGARGALESLLDEPVALKRIGILGYGATARAILADLHDNDAYTYVWGRDSARARAACRQFEATLWTSENPPEIVISTLPPDAQLPGDLVAALRTPDLVMDANYGPRATLGQRLGREVIGGDAMLEAQARASFDFWLAHLDRVAGG